VSRKDDTPHATRWEILGAWLHVWTPPRGVHVPPIPWRRIGLGALALAALVAVGLVTIMPAIDEGKQRGAEERGRQAAAARAAQEARLRHDQRATVVRLTGAPIERQVRAVVAAGARARMRSGELDLRRVLGVRCDDPQPGRTGRLRFECTAVETVTGTDPPVRTGLPFVAVVDRARGTLAWCKANEIAGEGAAFAQVRVPLPKACAG
jgi:hypothetical protein